MLKVARERVARLGLGHVKALLQMDATALEFAPASFDVALAPFVMSVVPDPQRVLDEMWRVLKPGGEIISVNHFSANSGIRARIEAAMEKSAGWLGWHPQFPYAAVGDWIVARPDAELLERREIAPLRLFTLLRIRKRAEPGHSRERGNDRNASPDRHRHDLRRQLHLVAEAIGVIGRAARPAAGTGTGESAAGAEDPCVRRAAGFHG